MATRVWVGAAPPIAQITEWVFGGTWEATDEITVTIGQKVYETTAGSTTIITIVDSLVTALNALDSNEYPEFSEITWDRNGNNLRGTADTSGVPFTCTLATAETGGGAADAQTIDGGASSAGVDTIACSGPNFANVAANWTGSTLPVDGDTVVFANSSISCLYGLSNSAVTPATIRIDPTFTGRIGLPLYNETNGYYEYRDRYLAYCTSGDATNTAVLIGQGDGDGSGRMLLDFGSGQVTVTVYSTGQPIESGVPSLLMKGTHTSNVFNVQKGSVGIAFFPGEASAIATLRVGYVDNVDNDADVVLGSGITQCTTVEKSGGRMRSENTIGTLTQLAGETTVHAGAMTTLDVRGGTAFWNSTGTLTTGRVSGQGTLDFSRDMRSKTVTNPIDRYGDESRIIDPFKVVASLVVDLEYSGMNLEPLRLGTHLKLTRGTPT